MNSTKTKPVVSSADQRRAAHRWQQLGYQVDFQPVTNQQLSPSGQFNYRVDQQRQQLVISYPDDFSPYQFFYQNAEAWATVRGHLYPGISDQHKAQARIAILSELICYCPAAAADQLRITKDYISKLSTTADNASQRCWQLGPRLAALNAWELLTVIKGIDPQLSQDLQAWRQEHRQFIDSCRPQSDSSENF